MKIVKKNGNIQDFDKDKLKLSLQKASDETDEPLNSSGLAHIANKVEAEIKRIRKDNTSAYEVFAVIIHCFNCLDYPEWTGPALTKSPHSTFLIEGL